MQLTRFNNERLQDLIEDYRNPQNKLVAIVRRHKVRIGDDTEFKGGIVFLFNVDEFIAGDRLDPHFATSLQNTVANALIRDREPLFLLRRMSQQSTMRIQELYYYGYLQCLLMFCRLNFWISA